MNSSNNVVAIEILRLTKIAAQVFIFFIFAILIGKVLPIPSFHADFMSLYHAVLGLTRGFSFYDFETQQKLILETHPGYHIAAFPYFPYPPWYGGVFFFLALLPFDWAYRTWLVINIGVISLCVYLLMVDQSKITRLLAQVVPFLFFPVIGLMVVGNYTLPVLLGSSLFVYAANKKDASLIAISLALMTFKPHIGFFMALAGFVWLVVQKSNFTRQSAWRTLIAGIVLAAIGFIVEPAWLLKYLNSISLWQTSSYIRSCGYCGNLASAIAYLGSQRFGYISPAWISAALFFLIAPYIFFQRKIFFSDIGKLMAAMAIFTALVLPYMVNYDFVILLLPFAYLFIRYNTVGRALLAILYLLPWLGIVFGRTTGDFWLTSIAIILFLLLLTPISAQLYNMQPARQGERHANL